MASRSRTIADALVTAINAWASKPAGVTAQRVRSLTALLQGMPSATPGTIAVIVSRSEDQSNRAEAAEDITLAIVPIINVDSAAVSAADAYDDFTEGLADYLRQSATFRNITVGSIKAQRKGVSIVTVADAAMLSESETFVSAIEITYFVSIGGRA